MSCVERFCIAAFGTLAPSGYNLTEGGEGTPGHKGGVGRKVIFTAEHRRKIGDAHRGRKLPESQRKKMSESRTGKKHPPRSQEFREMLSRVHKGKVLSLETRRKMSLARTGKSEYFQSSIFRI